MNHYEVLGVSSAASGDEVRRAYLARARQHHPDTGGEPAAMTEVNAAWTVLSDPVQRRSYDLALGVARLGDPPRRARTSWHAGTDGIDGAEAAADLAADLVDDRPIKVVRGPRVLPFVPPGLFLLSVAVGCLALVFDAPVVLGAAGVLFMLSCVAVAAVALFTLRGTAHR